MRFTFPLKKDFIEGDSSFFVVITEKSHAEVEKIIKVEELTKFFGEFAAVKEVSFEVERGEIFGILGPNGAGKTTLIKMLSTLLKPTSGRAFVAGYDVVKEPQKVRQNIGIVFQEPTLDVELTARENLDFHGRIYGMDRRKREKRISEVLELVGLSDKADVLVKKFSGGMQRRLEIARGFMHFPKVLFLDEPTLGLDVQTRRNIWDYIEKLRRDEDVTIILTTHYIEEAEHLCDRVAIIDFGKIIALDTVKNLKERIGKDTIEISVNGEFESILRKEKLSVVRTAESLVLSTSDGEKLIPKLFSLAQEHGVEIQSVKFKKSSLEDVFVLLTGRRIREESASHPMLRRIRR
ncbi:MAG: ATP-binding cassette domain-containing protein [Archaeoglobus sp.]|nr:ATP-binding cassette domain-containing protein [Archaeoglobus sp.]